MTNEIFVRRPSEWIRTFPECDGTIQGPLNALGQKVWAILPRLFDFMRVFLVKQQGY